MCVCAHHLHLLSSSPPQVLPCTTTASLQPIGCIEQRYHRFHRHTRAWSHSIGLSLLQSVACLTDTHCCLRCVVVEGTHTCSCCCSDCVRPCGGGWSATIRVENVPPHTRSCQKAAASRLCCQQLCCARCHNHTSSSRHLLQSKTSHGTCVERRASQCIEVRVMASRCVGSAVMLVVGSERRFLWV